MDEWCIGVQLLVDIQPTLAKEARFALKGGTAIILFEHDLPNVDASSAAGGLIAIIELLFDNRQTPRLYPASEHA